MKPADTHAGVRSCTASCATAFAPGSVGNIGVGFDLLGHAIDGVRDVARVRRIDEPVVRIAAIGIDDAHLSPADAVALADVPREAERNTAGCALRSLREHLGLAHGFELELVKGIALGSGLGGSAASCVAALVAANALLDVPLSRDELYSFALDGEVVASGSRHGDNVAPMLLGGVALATPTRMLALSAPEWLHAVVVHPDQILETRRARVVLDAPCPLPQVVEHGANLALFLTGLQRGDTGLLRAGLRDVLVEPRRASLIPGFRQVQAAALDHAAIGASISGAGPSVFAWFESRQQAQRAAAPMCAAFGHAGIAARAFVTAVNGPRAALLAVGPTCAS
ncbi:MAG: homoserine kinase [Proteobacteria bacterium]|nr:homoserine kinase [Pseudomonadota bacterium]